MSEIPRFNLTQTREQIDLGRAVLDYKPVQLTPQKRNEFTFDEAWGKARPDRWKNVGRMWTMKIFADDQPLEVGDDKLVWMIPPELDGTKLVKIVGFVSTQSSSGAITFQFANTTQALDVLSTACTIEANAYTSLTSPTQAVIKKTVVFAEGDLVAIDVDGIGTGAKGLGVQLSFI